MQKCRAPLNSPGMQTELSNWSKSARSPCVVYKVNDREGIARVLAAAHKQGLSVIPHGAGHSYTDAALNTGGVVIDVTPMRQILSWDPANGVMRVEPGVTLRDVVQRAWQDGWWPVAVPSTQEVTIGGCAAMNVNGRNAWKCGPFGASILALDILQATGEVCTVTPAQNPQLFYAVVGSIGLLGIITSITIQLQRISSGFVTVRRRPATSFNELFALFAEEKSESDYLEGWLDGFARGNQLGRGIVTGATLSSSADTATALPPLPGKPGRSELPLLRVAANLARPWLLPAVQMVNLANYEWSRLNPSAPGRQRPLFSYSFWPSAAFAGYHAMFPQGVETFQAFVPQEQAKIIFRQVMRYTQEAGCMPLWCIIKQHTRDPFLLSYQVDGFSLELNFQRTQHNAQKLQQVLQHMIAIVIEAGGRFYLAKDHFLTGAQYRRSMGDSAVDAFLDLKQRWDPETRLQSDLFRRLFQPGQS